LISLLHGKTGADGACRTCPLSPAAALAAKPFGLPSGCRALTILDGFSKALPWDSHFVD
jgi:hypothetical protein